MELRDKGKRKEELVPPPAGSQVTCPQTFREFHFIDVAIGLPLADLAVCFYFLAKWVIEQKRVDGAPSLCSSRGALAACQAEAECKWEATSGLGQCVVNPSHLPDTFVGRTGFIVTLCALPVFIIVVLILHYCCVRDRHAHRYEKLARAAPGEDVDNIYDDDEDELPVRGDNF